MARRTRDYWGQIDEDFYNELGNRATQEGMKIKDLIQRYIVEGLERDAGSEVSNLDSQIFLAVQKARAKERRAILLENLGAAATSHGSEEDYDNFESLCDKANMSVDEILKRIKQQRQPSSLPSFDDGKGARSAARWLQDFFNNLEGEKRQVGATEIKELGARVGFSGATLDAAKRSLKIKSVKGGMKWYWVMTEE